MGKKIIKIFIVLILAAGLGWIGHGYYREYQSRQKLRQQQALLLARKKAKWITLKHTLAREIIGFKGASSVVVQDLDTGWEMAHNKDRLFPAASLVKVPIMLACFQAVDVGRISLEQKVKLRGADKVGGSGILKNAAPGTEFTIRQLVEIMVTESDNTASNLLIDLLEQKYLNNLFKDLGFKNTNLSRKMMDFRYRKKGVENYTTAQDMANALKMIYHHQRLSPAVAGECLNMLKQQRINDRIPARLPEGTVVAHKTGLEQGVCHDAGVVFAPAGDFLICVLTKNGVTSRPAKNFISKIALNVYNYYKEVQ